MGVTEARDEERVQLNIKFPGRKFSSESSERSFQRGWFEKWKWLHYVKQTDCVLCFICNKTVVAGLVHDHSDSSFAMGGFCN